MYLMMLKIENIKVSKNFTSSELACKCRMADCHHGFMYYKTIDSAQRLRDHACRELNVTSAYRCQKHNENVGGHNDSYHKKGHAIDFAVPRGMAIEDFSKTAEMFFDVVIEYPDKNFIHCHNI